MMAYRSVVAVYTAEAGMMKDDGITKARSGIDMGPEGIVQVIGHRMARLTGPFAPGAAPSRRESGSPLLSLAR
jgi:hypothetical protein